MVLAQKGQQQNSAAAASTDGVDGNRFFNALVRKKWLASRSGGTGWQ